MGQKVDLPDLITEINLTKEKKEHLVNLFNEAKRQSDFDKAFSLLNEIKTSCFDYYLEHFSADIFYTKQCSVLFKKQKDKEKATLYSYLFEIAQLKNDSFRDRGMMKNYYLTDKFSFKDQNYENARVLLFNKFKPMHSRLKKELKLIKNDINDNYLNYNYRSSLELEKFFMMNSDGLKQIFNKIDNLRLESFLHN